MTLKLYYAPGACSFVPHTLLEATGAPFEPAIVKLHKGEQQSPEYRAINPRGQVPVLVDDGQVITQIVAIIGYLVPRFVIGLASDTVWANIPARMADAALPLLIGLELLLLGGALGIFAGSGMVRRRRRWNAPINTYRYTQDRWG